MESLDLSKQIIPSPPFFRMSFASAIVMQLNYNPNISLSMIRVDSACTFRMPYLRAIHAISVMIDMYQSNDDQSDMDLNSMNQSNLRIISNCVCMSRMMARTRADHSNK